MADNVTANAGSGGATFSTDDIGGIHYPRAKMGFGADGAYADVSASDPLPVLTSGTVIVQDGSGTLTVDGAVTATVAGTVQVSSLPGVGGTVSVSSLPGIAGTVSVSGTVPTSSGIRTDTVFNGATAAVPKFGTIGLTAAGDGTVVTAVSNNRIRVMEYLAVAGAATVLQWKSGANLISGPMSVSVNGGIGAAYSPIGLIQTDAGSALILNTSAAGTVGGHVVYVEIPA